MAFLPNYRPKQLSLGPLETEILNIIWDLKIVTVKEILNIILADPDRELAYASVSTILQRLTKKGWLKCSKKGRSFTWEAKVSREQAKAIQSYEQLNKFLAISNPDLVASFADSLDTGTIEQIKEIASRLEAIRVQRKEDN